MSLYHSMEPHYASKHSASHDVTTLRHYSTPLRYATTVRHYSTPLCYATTVCHYSTPLCYTTTICHYVKPSYVKPLPYLTMVHHYIMPLCYIAMLRLRQAHYVTTLRYITALHHYVTLQRVTWRRCMTLVWTFTVTAVCSARWRTKTTTTRWSAPLVTSSVVTWRAHAVWISCP